MLFSISVKSAEKKHCVIIIPTKRYNFSTKLNSVLLTFSTLIFFKFITNELNSQAENRVPNFGHSGLVIRKFDSPFYCYRPLFCLLSV